MALFDTWVRTPKSSKFDAIMRYVIEEVGDFRKSEPALKRIKNKIRSFYQTFKKKCTKTGGHRQRFLDTYSSWISKNIVFTDPIFLNVQSTSQQDGITIGPGRATKSFSTCGPKAQKYKLQHLLESSSQELSMATEMKLKKKGLSKLRYNIEKDTGVIAKATSIIFGETSARTNSGC